jgi:peptide/nickel transport system permease protein
MSQFVLKVPTMNVGNYDRYLLPSITHPLGTDALGRDILMLLSIGLKNSLLIGAITGTIATMIAITIALTTGYLGRKVNYVLSSATNAMIVIPSLPIIIVLTVFLKIDLITMCLVLAVFSWARSSRTLKSQILTLKERDFVSLARVSGEGSIKIMFAEIMPNIAPLIGVGFANSVVGAIMAETGLRLLGVGSISLPTLGYFLNNSLTAGDISTGHPWIVIAPSLLLILVFISLNFINTGIEERFNPRLKKITGL